MKEATGELNVTVITVVAIAAVAALFYAFLWPSIKTNLINNTKCSQAICSCTGAGVCKTCTYINEKGNSEKITCNLKG